MKQDKKRTLFKLIENSIGSKLFRNNYFFYTTKIQSKDVLKNGKLNYAFYVSSFLYFVKLISDLHTTVESTIKDLEKNEILQPKYRRSFR